MRIFDVREVYCPLRRLQPANGGENKNKILQRSDRRETLFPRREISLGKFLNICKQSGASPLACRRLAESPRRISTIT